MDSAATEALIAIGGLIILILLVVRGARGNESRGGGPEGGMGPGDEGGGD